MASETVGDLLARAMAEQGHTQEQAAEALGVSRRTINDWRGSARPVMTERQPRPSWDLNDHGHPRLFAFIAYTGEDPKKVAAMCGYDLDALAGAADNGETDKLSDLVLELSAA